MTGIMVRRPEQLAGYIERLETACREQPRSADLRTLLGMAHAMNWDAHQSLEALETAREIDPGHFLAQVKYAELLYRLRVLDRAEEETLRALDLAANGGEVGWCRRQLSEIRRLRREGTQKPAWTKPLWPAALWSAAVALALALAVVR